MAHPVSVRLAAKDHDLEFLSALARDPAVAPFLAPGRGESDALRELLSQGDADPYGLYVIEVPQGDRLGGLALTKAARTSPICAISHLMVRPDVRRSGIALAAVRLAAQMALVEHGLHRIEAQVYADNLAGQRLFERSGFKQEGIRRRAYWRRGQWLDGVLYGLLDDEL